MAEDYTILVDNLEDKISKVVDRYKTLKGRVNVLLAENEKLNGDLRAAKDKSSKLEEKYNTLKISKTLELADGDVNATKHKINELVREIDKCIALLNR